MAIKLLNTETELNAYTKLCAKQNGTVFNSLSWLKIYGDHLKLFGIFNANNELTGAFYFFEGKKYNQGFNICPPFTPHNGMIFENRAENSANINTVNKAVLEEVSDFISQLSSKLIVFVLPSRIKETQPFIWKNLKVGVKYTYHIDLNNPEEKLLSSLSSEKRKSLNKAKSDKLEVVKSEKKEDVKNVILKTFSRKQIQKNREYFDRIFSDFATNENSFSYVAYLNGKPIAATFCVYDETTAYYLFGGYDAESRHHGAGVSCMWNSILYAKQLGLRLFDFEGSMIPEVERYFREFGGELIPYYQVSRTQFPLNLVLKF